MRERGREQIDSHWVQEAMPRQGRAAELSHPRSVISDSFQRTKLKKERRREVGEEVAPHETK